MTLKLDEATLRQIIVDELSSLREDVDHEGVRQVVNAASKLLKACATFKEDPTPAMTDAVSPHLDSLIKVLESMINTPATYTVAKPPKKKKTIKLRAVHD